MGRIYCKYMEHLWKIWKSSITVAVSFLLIWCHRVMGWKAGVAQNFGTNPYISCTVDKWCIYIHIYIYHVSMCIFIDLWKIWHIPYSLAVMARRNAIRCEVFNTMNCSFPRWVSLFCPPFTCFPHPPAERWCSVWRVFIFGGDVGGILNIKHVHDIPVIVPLNGNKM